MDPVTAAMGGGSIASNIGFGFLGHDWALEAATTNRRWQEEMSNSAHQREVADLKKAGLNPILSANSGASTGSGGAAAMTPTPQIDMPAIWSQMNMQKQLDQGQQKIDIDKAISTATIAKSLSGAELDKAEAIATKHGVMSKFLGTTGSQMVRDKIKPLIDDFQKKRQMFNNPQGNNPPSSGGSIGGLP